MTYRAIVVDDEATARRNIVRLLSERGDMDVAGECSGGVAAVDAIHKERPAIVFLDIQMPDIDGFEVLERLNGDGLPAIVFTTAYDQYAVRAFEAAAVDYLLKPFDADRFNQAVDRALKWIRSDDTTQREAGMRRLLHEVVRSEREDAEAPAGAGRVERFMVKRRGLSQFIAVGDVDFIEADGNYLRLHVGQRSHLVRGTVSAAAERLDPRQFVRIHRRYILNMSRVKEVQPWFGGDQVVVLTTGEKLRLSRNFRELFESRMIGG